MTVSVIIPTYNCADYLPDAIRSVLDQSYPDVEIIVVDDGSTDNTPDVLEPFGERIIHHRQENAGVSVARNVGIERARGEYLAFLDADDFWFPDKLARQTAFLDNAPRVAAVFSDFSLAGEDGTILQERHIKGEYRVFEAFGLDWDEIFPTTVDGSAGLYQGEIFPSLFLGNFIKTSSLVVRREAALKAGGFSPHRTTQEDYEYFLKLAAQHPFGYIDQALLFKRRRPGQLTSPDRMEEILRVSLEVVEEFVDVATQRMGGETVKKRLADKHQGLASHYYKTDNRSAGLAHILKAMKLCPADIKNPALFFMFLIPRPALEAGIGMLKRLRSPRAKP